MVGAGRARSLGARWFEPRGPCAVRAFFRAPPFPLYLLITFSYFSGIILGAYRGKCVLLPSDKGGAYQRSTCLYFKG